MWGKMVGGAAARGVHGVDSNGDGLLSQVAGCKGVSFDSVPELLVYLGGRTFSGAGLYEYTGICAHRPTPWLRFLADEVVEGIGDRRGILYPDWGAAVCFQAGICGV